MKKKRPTLNDWAEVLKSSNIIEMPVFRKIQHLTDIRNLCDHKKDQEPNKDDIDELISGVSKIIKTLF
jgi:hypothetical protein